jgi:hypothetical protein
MRKLAIIEMILISLMLVAGGFVLYFHSRPATDRTFEWAIKRGNLWNSELIVKDKYQSGGRDRQYFIVLSGLTPNEEVIRNTSKGVYKSVKSGDTYNAYVYGNGYLIPEFDMNSTGGRWMKYSSAICWITAAAVWLLCYRTYKGGQIKHIARANTFYDRGSGRTEL